MNINSEIISLTILRERINGRTNKKIAEQLKRSVERIRSYEERAKRLISLPKGESRTTRNLRLHGDAIIQKIDKIIVDYGYDATTVFAAVTEQFQKTKFIPPQDIRVFGQNHTLTKDSQLASELPTTRVDNIFRWIWPIYGIKNKYYYDCTVAEFGQWVNANGVLTIAEWMLSEPNCGKKSISTLCEFLLTNKDAFGLNAQAISDIKARAL